MLGIQNSRGEARVVKKIEFRIRGRVLVIQYRGRVGQTFLKSLPPPPHRFKMEQPKQYFDKYERCCACWV